MSNDAERRFHEHWLGLVSPPKASSSRIPVLVEPSACSARVAKSKRCTISEAQASELGQIRPIDCAPRCYVPRMGETDHVSKKLKERFSDALFSARFGDIPGFIWLLLEHQSEPDHWIVLRVLMT